LEPVASFFAVALTALFVVVDPPGVVPVFAALTAGRAPAEVRRTALRASIAGAGILLGFALAGRALLAALGVDVAAFRVAGGLLLLATAADMLRAQVSACRCTPGEVEDARARADVAIVPVAIPMLAGPGALATVLVLMSRASTPWHVGAVLLAVVLTFAASWLALRSAPLVQRVVGPSVLSAVQRVLGLVLGALAVQFVVDGGRALLGV